MFTVYYLIKPKKALLERYPNQNWITPNLWKDKHDIARGSTAEDYALHIKLLFLAKLHDMKEVLSPMEEQAEFVQTVGEILGTPPYSVDIFDRWWTIEGFHPGSETEHMLEHTSVKALEVLAKTGNELVDYWIEWEIEQKKQQKAEKDSSNI